jgi:mannose-6-phosphate isomerase-like protein (cupin superfamily)
MRFIRLRRSVLNRIIVQGQAEVVLNGEIHRLNPGQTISIPQESLHRVGNASSSSEDLIFIEIQRGEYFGEDDIVRLEDDYGRK